MCGIFGYIGTRSIDLNRVTEIIKHRGPDSSGFYNFDLISKLSCHGETAANLSLLEGSKVSFGFRRLAIIDLEKCSDQPFVSENKKLCLIFNGEIYNYIEIKNKLVSKGYIFRTNSDTEVVLMSYLEWGQDCVNYFNGMWAFSILDIENEILFCSRDRFGVKPFYYRKTDKEIVFCSEIKQIFEAGFEKRINENQIRDYLEKSIINHNHETFFDEVFQLLPGHNMIISIKEKIIKVEVKKFWKLKVDKSYSGINYNEAKVIFKEKFIKSIKLRFRADVEVGSCLSGGLDSSSIVGIAATINKDKIINTFTSEFDNHKKFDEKFYVKKVHEKFPNLRGEFCTIEAKDVLFDIDKILWYHDEPFPTFSILAQWQVMKVASEKGVKVLLDGQGGDEILGGYRKYYAFFLKEKILNMDFIGFLKNFYYLIKNKDFDFFNIEGFRRYLNLKSRINFLSEKSKEIKNKAYIDFGTAKTMREKSLADIEEFSFPPLLRYEDRNSMAWSIEARVPFMDFEVVSFLHSLPSDFLIRNGFTKAILRDSLQEILPKEIVSRISKLGFSTPQSIWMENELKDSLLNYFNNMENPYLNSKEIAEDFSKYPQSQLHSYDFSRFYIFDRWYQLNFNTSPNS